MELKLEWVSSTGDVMHRSNRTFMELKCEGNEYPDGWADGF